MTEILPDSPALDDEARLAHNTAITHGRGVGALAQRMGIEFLEFTAERARARMPVEGNTQPLGLVHGGAYVVLGESLGSMCANLHGSTFDAYAVGIDINATHTRSATKGWVHAECTALHLGRSLTVHEIVCRDDEGKRLSTIRITNTVRPRKDRPHAQ